MSFDKNIKIAFLGGDMRSAIAAMKLADKMNIFAWRVPGIEGEASVFCCNEITEAVSDAYAIVLPLPASLDGALLNCKAEGEKIFLKDIIDILHKDSLVVGGKIPREIKDYAAKKGIKSIDYFESESFQIKNAYTTAEAALNIAMNSLLKNIRGAKIAVTGYGRISKQLVKLLLSLDAHITLAARKESDLTWARLSGCETLKIGDTGSISQLCSGYDIIFNTVPYLLFDEEFLVNVDKKTLLIELASTPGGIDVSAAKRLKSAVLWAASLPGKYAPESAGELIAECVNDIIEAEVNL